MGLNFAGLVVFAFTVGSSVFEVYTLCLTRTHERLAHIGVHFLWTTPEHLVGVSASDIHGCKYYEKYITYECEINTCPDKDHTDYKPLKRKAKSRTSLTNPFS